MRPQPQSQLRIAVVVDSLSQPAWVGRVLDTIKSADLARVTHVIVARPNTSRHAAHASTAYALYSWSDARLFRKAGDASVRSDIRGRLPADAAVIDTGRDVQPVEADVVLQFSAPDGIPAMQARFGVWSVRIADGWAEFATQQEVTTAVLEVDGRPVARTAVGTDAISLRRGLNRLQWKSAALICASITRLYNEGTLPAIDAGPAPVAPSASDARLPGAGVALGAAMRYVVHQLRRRFMRQQWFVAFRFRDDANDPNDRYRTFHRLSPPPDRLWADPFVVANSPDHAYLFVEELVYAEGRGVISVMDIRRDGTSTMPRRILEKPHHLSYPCVFRWEDTFYMLPETGANETVELYRCKSFPYEWEPAAVLMQGIQAVDATIFEDSGRWWMFLSTAPDGELYDELHLFHASSPLGPWAAHPQNPVVSDVTAGRSAGRPFRRGGHLFRPAQNGARRYGHSMKLREIVELTTTRFAEREVGKIEPDWMRGLLGTHTLNSDGEVTVIDGVRYRWGRR